MDNAQPRELLKWATTTDYAGPIGITVKLAMKDSEVDNFRSFVRKNQELADTYPGCKMFKMSEDIKDENCFWLVQEWESIESWKPYLFSQERAANADATFPLMTGSSHLAMYKLPN